MEPLRYEAGTANDISLRSEFSIIIVQKKFLRIDLGRMNEKRELKHSSVSEDDSDRCPDGRIEILKVNGKMEILKVNILIRTIFSTVRQLTNGDAKAGI
uniref:Uncharacterized protein n=1 Tax=Wuchereria bancrofti TaxID=6293 RepID=A0A1I8EFV1_WUCBA